MVQSNRFDKENLPSYYYREDTNLVYCGDLSIRESIKILWHGELWVETLTNGRPLQPQKISSSKPSMYYERN